VIRLEIEAKMPEELRAFVQQALSTADDEVLLVDGVLAMNELSQLTRLDRPDLEFSPYVPRHPNACAIMAAISSRRSGKRI
jgi:polyphosphate kinase